MDSAQDSDLAHFEGNGKFFFINATGLRVYSNFKRKKRVKVGSGNFNNHWILKIAHQFLKILSIQSQSQNKTN